MFDTMTVTKAASGVLGALLFFMLSGWAAESIYHSADHHGDDHHDRGYAIEVADAGDDEEDDEPEIPFAEIYASADAGAGQGLWRQCQACHKLEAGANGTGPYLHDLVGRPIGSADGFAYSEVLASMGGEWTPEEIAAFIENPKGYAPGTKMSYSFRGDDEDKANLIAYLATIN